MRQVRWGVLGLADIALKRVIPVMQEAPSSMPLAIASRSIERANEAAGLFGIERAYGSYGELLDDSDIEAVYIPLPNHLHVSWTMMALLAGKHVLCEKPLCLTSGDAVELARASSSARRHLEEGFAYRNHPQWDVIESILSSRQIGTPLAVQATIAKRFMDPNDIRNNAELGGGATYDLAIYPIDACNRLFGRPPERVVATMDLDPQFNVDRLTSAMLDYGDAQASLVAGSQSGTSAWATHQQFSVLGSHGWLRCDFPYAHAQPSECRLEVGDLGSVGAIATTLQTFPPENQYRNQIERFSKLILGEAVRHWPVELSISNLRTIEALFESARSHEWVTLSRS